MLEWEQSSPLFFCWGLRSGIYPRGIQIGAIVLSQGIHLGAHGGCFQWAMLTSLSGDRKDPSPPGGEERTRGEEGGVLVENASE